MMKINAIYLRKSSIANSEEMRRFERQVKELTETVKGLATPYIIYNDYEASSRSLERAEYNRMKEDIQAGLIKAVYCIDDSRLTRSDSEALLLIALLKKKKVRLITLLHGEINLLDRQSLMVAKIKAIFNEFEHDNTTHKIEEGKIRAIKSGAFIGKVPFGYKRDTNTKKLIPDETAKLVVFIFNRYMQGHTTRQIAEELGQGWQSTKISRILRNRTYLGEIRFRSEYLEESIVNKEAHEPLIETELFLAVQKLLCNRKR
jgi:site-specific DNA recombinase